MRKYPFASLRVKLVLLVLIAVMPSLAITLYSGFEQRSQAYCEALDKALLLATEFSIGLERMIENARQMLFTLSQMPQVRNLDAEACSLIFSNLLKQTSGYTGFVAIRPNGDMFASGEPLPRPINVADRPWYRRLVQTKGFVIGEYHIGRVSGKPAIILAYPVLDNTGQLKVILTTGLDLDWLNKFMTKNNLPQGASLSVVDSEGMILVRHPEPEKYVGKVMAESAIVKEMFNKRVGVTEAIGLDGVPRLYGFKTIGHRPEAIHISVGIPEKIAFAEVYRQTGRNLFLLGLVAALALIAAWFVGGFSVVQPVNRLLDVTNQLAKGDLNVRSGPSYAGGEIGQLACAFDQMAEALQRREAERKQAEQERRKSEEHFREVIEDIFRFVPEALLVFTDKLNLFKHNKAFRDIVQEYSGKLNYTEEELTETILKEVKSRITTGDRTEIRIPKKQG